MKNTLLTVALTLSLIFTLSTSSVMADEVPPMLPVQGFLTDSDGDPIDGNVDIRFRIYDDADEFLHHEVVEVTVSNGSFSHYLGSEEDLDLSIFHQNTHLELGIRVGSDEEMSPRMQLATVPYAAHAATAGEAFFAHEAAHAESAAHADVADSIAGSLSIYRVTNQHCFETPGTLMFSSQCRVPREVSHCSNECPGVLNDRVINCQGECDCASVTLCTIEGCPPYHGWQRCDNTYVGEIIPASD